MEIQGIEVLKDGSNYISKKMIRVSEFEGIYRKCKVTEYSKDFQITFIDNDDETNINFEYNRINTSEEDYDLIDFEIKFLDYDYEEINTIRLQKIQKCRISFDKDGVLNGIIFDSSIASRTSPIDKSYMENLRREYAQKKQNIRVDGIEAIRDGYNYDSKDILDITKFFDIYINLPKFSSRYGTEFEITMKCQDTLVENIFIYSFIQDESSQDNGTIVKKLDCSSPSNNATFTFNKKQKCKVVFYEDGGVGRCTGIRICDLDNKIYEQSASSGYGSYSKLRGYKEERYDAIEYMRDNGYDPENDSFDDM